MAIPKLQDVFVCSGHMSVDRSYLNLSFCVSEKQKGRAHDGRNFIRWFDVAMQFSDGGLIETQDSDPK